MGYKFKTARYRGRKQTLHYLYHFGDKMCVYCRRVIVIDRTNRLSNRATLDHKQPLGRNGEDARHNIVLSCFKCNQTKADSTMEEWEAWMAAHPRWWETGGLKGPRVPEPRGGGKKAIAKNQDAILKWLSSIGHPVLWG